MTDAGTHQVDSHTRALWALAVRLSAAASQDEVCDAIIRQAIATLGASAGSVLLPSRDGTGLDTCASVGVSATEAARQGHVDVVADVPAADAFRTGQDVYVRTLDEWRARYRGSLPIDDATSSLVALVLRAGDRRIGVLTLTFATPLEFGERDRIFLEAIAAECAQALERAELYDRERAARADAENASRAKDEFLAALSHELRTPINAILGWAQLLRKDALAGDQALKAFETIERNAKLQAQLVNDLLDMSRIVSGRLHLDVREVHLGPLLSRVADGARPAADAKRITLVASIDASVGPVLGDPDRLVQALWNLASNAVKFTPKGGRVELRLDQLGSSARVTVADTGKGIAAEALPTMFDRLRRGPDAASAVGLGLGLAIVRHIVEAHGGVVGVTSEGVGRGAVFTVQLPLAAVSADVPVSSILEGGPDAPRLDHIRIVLVEDDPDSRTVEEHLLTSYGASVRAFGNAAEAWSALQRERPDVLIADIGLPDEDGFSLVRRLRAYEQEHDLPRVPAVALTAFAGSDARKTAMLAGFNIHLGKPIDIGELVTVVFGLAGKRG